MEALIDTLRTRIVLSRAFYEDIERIETVHLDFSQRAAAILKSQSEYLALTDASQRVLKDVEAQLSFDSLSAPPGALSEFCAKNGQLTLLISQVNSAFSVASLNPRPSVTLPLRLPAVYEEADPTASDTSLKRFDYETQRHDRLSPTHSRAKPPLLVDVWPQTLSQRYSVERIEPTYRSRQPSEAVVAGFLLEPGVHKQVDRLSSNRAFDYRPGRRSTSPATLPHLLSPAYPSRPTPQRRTHHSKRFLPVYAVTKEELMSVSPCIRTRVTLEKVNETLKDILSFLLKKYQILADVRSRLQARDKNVQAWLQEESPESSCTFWFSSADVKKFDSKSFKMDMTGKAILNTLRVLNRILPIPGDTGANRVRRFCLAEPIPPQISSCVRRMSKTC